MDKKGRNKQNADHTSPYEEIGEIPARCYKPKKIEKRPEGNAKREDRKDLRGKGSPIFQYNGSNQETG